MKAKTGIFTFYSLLFVGVIFFLLPQAILAQQQTTIPFDTLNWEKVSCSHWNVESDSITLYGTDYRAQGIIESKGFFDLSQSEIYIKWKVDAAGKFMAVTLYAGGYPLGKLVTTDHTCCDSKLIQENQWYYTQVKFHADSSFTAIRSTGNFYDQGGKLFDSIRQKATPKRWKLGIKNGKIKAMIHDNYGGDKCSITLETVILKNAVKISQPSIITTKSFSFEDGKIPPEMASDTNSTWSIADTGFQSHKSVFIEQTPGHSSWLEMNVTGAAKVSFDVRFVSGYSWNTVMTSSFALDTLNMVTFDRSNKGCWHHFEWLIPDPFAHHNLRWYSNYPNQYPQDNSKLWIDNITIYYTVATGVHTAKDNSIQSVRIFPMPVITSSTIEYQLNKSAFVQVEIVDITGRKIQLLENRNKPAGTYRLKWQPLPGMVSGTYFCRISTEKGFVMKKVVIEK